MEVTQSENLNSMIINDFNSTKSNVEWATPELAADVLDLFMNTPSPSQIAPWTMGPVIDGLLKKWKIENYTWDANYKGTGNGIMTIGNPNDISVWIIAHWDVISFLIKKKIDQGYELVPFHQHMMLDGSQSGQALRYDLRKKKYTVICKGTIIGGEMPVFCPEKKITLRSGDRILYDTPINNISDHLYSGPMDNEPGCAGALIAGAILSRIQGVNVRICFVDEEEGPVAIGNTAFARGSRRLLRYLPPPKLAIVVDHHTVSGKSENPHMGKGALIREYASKARGGVTPPWLYETVRELAKQYAPLICLNENIHADVSRSDCVAMMEVTPNIVLCGPPTVGRHYADGIYKCSSYDIAHLARSLVMITHYFQDLPHN
jgi:putative aminopeptidase FrvX